MKTRKRQFVANVESIEGRLLLSTAPHFTIKDLGVVSVVGGINASGQVVGTTAGKASVSTNGGPLTPIETSAYNNGFGVAINDSGNIAASIDAGYSYSNAFLYKVGESPNSVYGVTGIDGSVTPVSSISGSDWLNYTIGFAKGINNSNIVVGYQSRSGSLPSETLWHAFFYNGTLHDINQQNWDSSQALSINNSNQIVGWFHPSNSPHAERHAFFYDGTAHDLGTLGGDSSTAYGINDSGQVVGSAVISDGTLHAFLSDPNGGPIHDIGLIANSTSDTAFSVNHQGHVVGTSWMIDGSVHGFFFDGGSIIDLNSVTPQNSGFVISEAYGINNSDQIAAGGWDSTGYHALLLTPIPPAPTAPTITWSNPADITYGTPLSSTQLDATASVPGTFTYSVPQGTVLHAGAAQVIQATFTPDDLVHYTTATAEALINVTKRPIIVYANPVTKVYGAPVPDGSFYYTGWNNQQGFVNGDTPQSIGLNPVLYSAGTVNASTPVGVYNAFPLVSNMFDDYTVSTGGTTITITPAPLTVTANNAQVHYGFTIPPLTGTITGLVNGDTDVATYTTTAVRGSWAGYYPIVPHLTDPNYNITFVNGTLTIYWSVPPIG